MIIIIDKQNLIESDLLNENSITKSLIDLNSEDFKKQDLIKKSDFVLVYEYNSYNEFSYNLIHTNYDTEIIGNFNDLDHVKYFLFYFTN